jgi:hypothetical protein
MRVDFKDFGQDKASDIVLVQVHQEVSCLEDNFILACLGFFASYFGYFCGLDLDLVLQDALALCLVISILVVLFPIQEVEHDHWA